MPYEQGFDTYPPTGWTEARGYMNSNTTMTGTVSNWTSDGFANVTNTGSARMNIYATNRNEWMFSPAISLTGGINTHLEFDIALTAYSGGAAVVLAPTDSVAVVISTDGGLTWSNTDTLMVWAGSRGDTISNVGQSISIDLSAYTGIVKFGFYATKTVTGGDVNVYIDNFVVRSIVPNDISAKMIVDPSYSFNMTSTMPISLNLKNNGSATQSGYSISYSVDSGATFISETISTPLLSGVDTTILFSSTIDLSNISDIELIATVSNPGDQFTSNDTIHQVVTNNQLPYIDDFESSAITDFVPTGWSYISATNNAYAYVKLSAYGAYSGTNVLRFYNSGGTTGDLTVSLPPIHSPINALLAKMYLNFSAVGDQVYVGVMSDCNDASTFVAVDTITGTNSYAQYIVDFSSYTGTGKYITFKHPLSATYKNIYIDDIEIYVPVNNDLSMLSVGGFISEMEMPAKNFTVSIYNNGLAAQTNFPVSYSIDGGATYVTETITATINPEDTLDYTFTTNVNIPTGDVDVIATVNNSGDMININDSAFYSVSNFSLPYITGFENDVPNEMANGWSILNTTGNASAYGYIYNSAYSAHTGIRSLKMYNYNAISGDLMLVLPKDNTTNGVSSKVLKFWAKGGTNYTLIIGVMPSDTAAASFVGVDTISVPSEYTLYTIDFSSYAGSDKYVAIKHGMNSTYDSYNIDDIDYFEPFQNDISALSIETPATTICESSTFTFDAVFNNKGNATQNNVAVTAVITDPNGVITTLVATTGSISKTINDTVNFSSVDVTAYGTYNIEVYSSLTGDEDMSNDTMFTSFELLAPLAVDHIENFSDYGPNWIRDGFYISTSYGNNSIGLGKSFSSYSPDGDAKMNLKIGAITSNSMLVFDYRLVTSTYSSDTSFLSTGDEFYIYISSDCGATNDTLYTIDTNNHIATTEFAQIQIPLAAYAGQNIIIGVGGHRDAAHVGNMYFCMDNYGVATPVNYELGNDTTICDNDSLMLGMEYVSGYTYMWTINGDTLANTNFQIPADSIGVYTVEVNAPLGMAYDTLTIAMNASTVCSFTGLGSSYCNNEGSVALVGMPTSGAFSGTGVSGSSFDPTASEIGTQIITYTFTNGFGCITTADSIVEVYIAPVADMTAASEICEGDSIMISATANFNGPALFFSMYIEGSSNNKALEVCNPTSADINLDEYIIKTNYNGNAWSGIYSFPVGAVLAAGDVFVIANDQADNVILAVADDTLAFNEGGYIVGFNGDDVRGLCKIKNNDDTLLIDIIGRYDMVDPGSGWDVAGVTDATKDHSLVRKANVVSGSNDWDMIAGTDVVSSQYIVNAKNDFTGIGSHTFNAVANNDTYLWDNGATTSSIWVMPTTTTTYSVTVSNTNCTETGDVEVTVNAYPVVDLGADQTIKWTAGSVTLDAGNTGMVYIWSTGETTQTATYDQTNLAVGDTTISVIVDNNGCTATDTIVITVLNDVSISDALNNVNVSIYPNPNNGQFTLSINGAEGNMNMEIVNLAGQVIYTQHIEATSNFTTDIDVSEFATGVYYIKLSNNDGVKVNKLIIK